jgi:hypothetical protein
MREAGFSGVACGEHGPEAWAIAEEWNRRWDQYRSTGVAHRWPPGSLGEAFDRYRGSETWKAKKPRTHEDWERGWRYIGPVFGDTNPKSVRFEDVDAWYAKVLREAGVREAWRAMKIWRALWQAVAPMKYCHKNEDPSSGVTRKTPAVRQEVWKEPEVVRRAKTAIRGGYLGRDCQIFCVWGRLTIML